MKKPRDRLVAGLRDGKSKSDLNLYMNAQQFQ